MEGEDGKGFSDLDCFTFDVFDVLFVFAILFINYILL